MLTQEKLKSILLYDSDTGDFIWIKSIKGTRGIGKKAGTVTNKGYVDVCINGKKYGLHRLAFLYKTGSIPKTVDHINGIKSDNRWDNLRECSLIENALNSPIVRSKSGFKNVYHDPRGVKKWAVVVFDVKGNKHCIGYYLTPEEGNVAAIAARERLQGEFNSDRRSS